MTFASPQLAPVTYRELKNDVMINLTDVLTPVTYRVQLRHDVMIEAPSLKML